MHAERAPFIGIVLALVFVAVETVGLIAYAPAPVASSAAASEGKPGPVQSFKRIKVRCRKR
jgi:hypothetical protein